MRKSAPKKAPKANENARRTPWWVRLAVASGVTLVAGGVLWFALTSSLFSIRDYEFRGNRYLSDAELMRLMDVNGGENIFRTSSASLAGCLSSSPWIRSVRVRKEFPHRMIFLIEESAPQAVLQDRGNSYIVDADGKVLQSLSGRPTVFLPVITGDRGANPAAYLKAVELAGVLRDMGMGKDTGGVEISGMEHGAHELTITLNGLNIKIGEDRFKEKLAAFDEIKDQIAKLDIAVEYVDLRFEGRVVVRHIATADATGDATVEKNPGENPSNEKSPKGKSSKDKATKARPSRVRKI